jgi:hypothetical protein
MSNSESDGQKSDANDCRRIDREQTTFDADERSLSVFEDGVGEARPDECDCGESSGHTDLPCWPCFNAGFTVRAGHNTSENATASSAAQEVSDDGE